MYAEDNTKIREILNSLDELFIRTGSGELIHIKEIESLIGAYHFQHDNALLYSEVYIKIEGARYSQNSDIINQENIRTAYITIDTATIIRVNDENIAVLLLDDCRLVRHAAAEWYKENKKAS